jgi:flagellar biosynthesis component FlhA
MKNILYLLLIVSVAFAACKKEPQPMSRRQMQHKIDSLTQIRIRESDEQAKQDLDDRMKIEVKVKVDSIISARQNPPKKDTLNKARAIRPDIAARRGLNPVGVPQVRHGGVAPTIVRHP